MPGGYWGFRNYWRLQFFPGVVGRGGGGGASGAFLLPAFPWSSLAKVLSGVFMVSQAHNRNCNIPAKVAKMRITAQEIISPVAREVARMAAQAASVVVEAA